MGVAEDDGDKELAKFRAWAHKRFYLVAKNDLEDLVQYCSHEWAQGKRLTSSYLHIATDYFRKYGKKIEGKRGSQDALAQFALHVDQMETVDWEHIKPANIYNQDVDKPIPEKLLKGLKNIERAIIILHFYWGFSQREVAHILGVTESRVSQRMRTIKKYMSDRLGKLGYGDKL